MNLERKTIESIFYGNGENIFFYYSVLKETLLLDLMNLERKTIESIGGV